MLNPGDKVRMKGALKDRLYGECTPYNHVAPTFKPEENMPDDGCLRCSTAHVEKFGNCIGIVIGPTEEGWEEVDVRWQPSNLRYGHHPDDLEKV